MIYKPMQSGFLSYFTKQQLDLFLIYLKDPRYKNRGHLKIFSQRPIKIDFLDALNEYQFTNRSYF